MLTAVASATRLATATASESALPPLFATAVPPLSEGCADGVESSNLSILGEATLALRGARADQLERNSRLREAGVCIGADGLPPHSPPCSASSSRRSSVAPATVTAACAAVAAQPGGRKSVFPPVASGRSALSAGCSTLGNRSGSKQSVDSRRSVRFGASALLTPEKSNRVRSALRSQASADPREAFCRNRRDSEEEKVEVNIIALAQTNDASGEKLDLDFLQKVIASGGVDVNMRDDTFGWTALMFSASQGNVVVLQFLLRCRARVDLACGGGNSPLHFAARCGCLLAVDCLLAARAGLELRNANGWTPLTWSAINGHEKVAARLIEAAAQAQVADADLRTPCMWAARHWHVPVVVLLLAAGVDLEVEDKDGLTATDHAWEHVVLRDTLHDARERHRRLAAAARHSDVARAREELEAGAHPNAACAEEDGRTPLQLAVEAGCLELVRLLLQYGATLEVSPNARELAVPAPPGPQQAAAADLMSAALTATSRLVAAAESGDWAVVRESLLLGAWVNSQPRPKLCSAMMWAAASHGAEENVMLLMDARANLELKDSYGWTAVHYAATAENLGVLSTLHYCGSDISAKTYDGSTAVHIAVRANSPATLQLLAAAPGVDFGARDAAGEAPAQLAVKCGFLAALQTLLAYRADAGVKDSQKRSLFALAVIHGDVEILAALLEPTPRPPVLEEPTPFEPPSADVGAVAVGDEIETAASAGSDSGGETRSSSRRSSLSLTSSARTGDSFRASRAPPLAAGGGLDRLAGRQWPGQRPRPNVLGQRRTSTSRALAPPSVSSRGRRGSNASSAASAGRRNSQRSSGKFGKGRCAQPQLPPDAFFRKTFGRAGLLAKASKLSCIMAEGEGPTVAIAATGAMLEQDVGGRAALALAVLFERTEAFDFLLALKAKVDQTDLDGNTPLMLAARAGKLPSVERLIAAGAAVGVRNTSGKTPLDIADGHPEVQQLLKQRMVMLNAARALRGSASVPGRLGAQLTGDCLARPSPKIGGFRIRFDGSPVMLPADLVEEQIRLFLQRYEAWEPMRVEVPVHPITSRPRGFAFAEFQDIRTAQAALRGDRQQLHRGIVRVTMEPTKR